MSKKLPTLKTGTVVKAPDKIDHLLAQHEVKRKARRAVCRLDEAATKITDACTLLSFAPVSAEVQRAVSEALKQLKIATAKVSIFVERLPPKEKS
jgi:IS5 family transposase